MGRAERSPLPGSVRARLRRALTPDTARGGANRGTWIPVAARLSPACRLPGACWEQARIEELGV